LQGNPGATTPGDDNKMGYLGVAMQVAFYELNHAVDFGSSLERVVSLGGDADTNGCIAGAMMGALFGADAIPQKWVQSVKGAKQRYKGRDGGQEAAKFFSLAEMDELVEQLGQLL